MSHFALTVIMNEQPTEETLEKYLLPYHEFECTGLNAYIEEIDQTEGILAEYAAYNVNMVKLADGTIIESDDDRCYRPATDDEVQQIMASHGAFNSCGLNYMRTTTEDGTVYKINELPEGAEMVKVHAAQKTTAVQFIIDEYGYKPVRHGEEIDIEDEHKFGYVLLDADGNVERIVRRTNPNSKWDWWMVGGRFSGLLLPKEDGDGIVLKGDPGVMGSQIDEHGVDIAQLKNIDIDGMRKNAETKAEALWDKVHEIIGEDIESFMRWNYVRDTLHPGDHEAARVTYHNQDAMKKLTEAKKKEREAGTESELCSFYFDIEDFIVSKEEYVKRKRNSAVTTFAFLNEGKWSERGNMGWWGIVTNEEDTDKWDEKFNEMLDGLSPETWLTVVDCHI